MSETMLPKKLPRWAELPDLELYMDQVLALAERSLGPDSAGERRGLTASMVNNYVKQGVLPPPVRKKYSRAHVARLLVICLLKPVLPIASVRKLIEAGVRKSSEQAFYDGFCRLWEENAAVPAENETAETPAGSILRAALRSRAEQALALRLLEDAASS